MPIRHPLCGARPAASACSSNERPSSVTSTSLSANLTVPPETSVGTSKTGGRFVALLALSDEGAPAYDHDHAAALAALGAPAFACTPDLFPEVMAAALERRPLPLPDKA